MLDNSLEKRQEQALQTKALFGFARELGRVRRENVVRLDRHPWHLMLSAVDSSLPGVRKWEPGTKTPNVLLSVEQQDLPVCPAPPQEIAALVSAGWDKPEWMHPDNAPAAVTGDPRLARQWSGWLEKRREWLLAWDRASRSLDLFRQLYVQGRFIEDSNLRYVAKAGSISFASDAKRHSARHPLLTHPVNFRLNVEQGRAVISIVVDLSEHSRFESELLSSFPEDNLRFETCQPVREDVERCDPHPFDTAVVRPGFQRMAATISPESRWAEPGERPAFNERVHFVFYEEPVFWIEERVSGMAEAADRVIRHVNGGAKIPQHLVDLICGVEDAPGNAPARDPQESLEKRIACAGGEDPEILLAKPANREQLKVAREVREKDAVLVMGPPGTGKTHTIANLIGDLLAQGKTVLVSSQKEKALRVLKSMLPEPLQDLCVSITNERDDVLATVQALTDRLALIRCEDLEHDIAAEEKSRASLLEELAQVRRKLFDEICREFTPVTLCGRQWTPSSLGKWLAAHSDLASVLPDQDIAEGAFPFTDEELRELYALMRSTPGDAGELLKAGGDVLKVLPEPAEEARIFAEANDIRAYLDRCGITVESLPEAGGMRRVRYASKDLEIEARSTQPEPMAGLLPLIEKDRTLGLPDPWVLAARAAGTAGGAIAGRWEKLLAALSQAASLSEKEIGQMDELAVEIDPSADRKALREALVHFRDNRIFGEPGFLTKLTQKSRLAALSSSRVNGRVPSSEHAYGAVLLRMELEEARESLKRLWESLVTGAGGPTFESLGVDHPEAQIKLRYGPRLEKALGWWRECAQPLLEALRGIGVNTELLTGGAGAGPLEACEALSRNVEQFLRPAATADRMHARLAVLQKVLAEAEKAAVRIRSASPALGDALIGGLRHSPSDYEAAWKQAASLDLEMPSLRRREELLLRIEGSAPQWAEAMREGRPEAFPPNARDAWNWQQLDHWFKGYLGTDFGELQKKAQGLSARLSAETVKLSANRAWLALARRMQGNRSLMQKLQGWAQIATRIGRGTGRGVESLRAQARDLMRACSQAVPCWIMPAESALSTFDGSWKFSVVVIDEASQSDIVSMPILFLGEKAVIAGDDRQVSPAAVGVGDSAVAALSRQYIQGRIANWAIYQAQSSLYDLAKTAYAPQMLREHFRCVPPIIGYSNELSYGGAILPLRDAASTNLMPPIVPVRVHGSRAANDTNLAEAEAIAGRIKACLARPEYSDKTFGVIVMRSGRTGAQIGLINNLILRAVGPEAIERHKILTGLSPDFQGDERDVIFLSLVDSPDGDKPLRRETAGQDDGMRKRWNVAVSRARDQIWAVYSFDADTQLQEGDIRKTFFDYLKAPAVVPGASAASFEMPEFAEDVAQALEKRSYTVIRGYRAGAFTLPLVVEGSGFKAVLECDGELQTPDAQRVVDEMERQAILERAGWKFARVRGGEWYRDPQSALWWLVSDLEDLGVKAPGSGEPRGVDGTLMEEVQTQAKGYEEHLHEALASAESGRERRERIIAELRRLEREVDDEVKKGVSAKPA